ncbi:MAG: DedA family protein [Gemmatimonadaceae bacterium]
MLQTILDYVLHLDTHLATVVQGAGLWTYAILALIIFAETGLVITPFLPGDSLLFATGAIAATASLNIWVLFVLLSVCAIIGDAVNYWVGSKIGAKAAEGRIPYVKKEYIQRTHQFYERYGARTIVLARFVPIVRTFAPFVAGAGTMSYRRFAAYNVIGGVVWVGSMLFSGYLFGNIPVVKDNFTLVVLGIIFVSILPGVVAVVQERNRARQERTAA